MSSVKKEARLSGMLLARKGSALPAHTDHRLTVQAFDAQQKQSSVEGSARQDFKAEETDHSSFVDAVKEINDVTKRQYNKSFNELEVKAEPIVKVAAEPKVEKAVEPKVDVKVEPKVVEKIMVGKVQPVDDGAPTENKRADQATKRIAMTLRMEQEDHLKLRLYAAHSRQSCQEIISAALDMYLSEDQKVSGMSECSCLKN